MDTATEFKLSAALYSAVLPIATVAVVSLLTLAVGGARGRHAALTLGVGAAITVGLLGVGGLPAIPPVDTIGWVTWAVPVAIVLASLLTALPVPRGAVRGGGVVLAAITAFLIVRPVTESWGGGLSALWILGAALACGLPAIALGGGIRAEDRAPALLATLGVAALAGSGVAMMSGSAKIAQLHGAVAAALGGGFALAWAVGKLRAEPALIVAPFVALGGLQLYALVFVEIPTPSAVLTIATPLAGLAASSLVRSGNVLRGLVVATLVAALPAAAAVGYTWAVEAQAAAADPYGGAY